ncbi:DUF3626 domain-containing protein [Pseudonocardia sp. MH-G8]|uniref:DUF3626 domain-containing protein n=1 Tax=Pseudonocardia sp. MH-G8 TaxID=1854588 RepID=UPI002101432E|nr:DUF3626 domain-containing protein [Pseudonocardia sp. MH-G8]
MALGDAHRAALAHVGSTGRPTGADRRVMLHFHPDWPFRAATVLEAIAGDRRYRSQFETATSNGGLTARPGGDRWRWENRMFGGAYDTAAPADRPTYGALDVHRRPIGAAPRFGSAHLRLAAAVLDRTTCCFPDSVFEPTALAPARAAGDLIALALAGDLDPLDDYVEAQVHGPLRLPEDVEALVLDPSHRGTAVEEAAARLGCPVQWHGGFRLEPAELARHVDYRGPEPVALGLAIAGGEVLDPALLGTAAREGGHDPQVLKKVWHLLARFGSDRW